MPALFAGIAINMRHGREPVTQIQVIKYSINYRPNTIKKYIPLIVDYCFLDWNVSIGSSPFSKLQGYGREWGLNTITI